MSVGLTRRRLAVVRLLVLLVVTLGVSYVGWRWLASVNWAVGWIAVPLVLAETGALLDTALRGATMWHAKERGEPPPPPPGATVDVIVTTRGEPVAAVLATAVAARSITHPHRTWILDDRERPDVRRAAEAARVGYLAQLRHPDEPRPPTAADLDRALFATDGEFLLVLAAGQVPAPTVLVRTLGYFRDPDVAVVQVPRADPGALVDGSLLFAGPIQQGKDGLNAAFCCDATAVLRREALIQLGIASCVRPVDRTVRRVLRTAENVLRNAREEAKRYGPGVLAALDQVEAAVDEARRDLRTAGRRTTLAELTYRFRLRVTTASRGLVDADVVAPHTDFAERARSIGWYATPATPLLLDSASLAWLSRQEMSPRRAMASVRALVEALDITRVRRVPVRRPRMSMRRETLSVPEDVTTAMRLHAMGWKSVYHPEVLVHRPADVDSAVAVRRQQHRAAVTLAALLREPPVRRGLSVGQRLMYLATFGSHLAGYRALGYLAAPALFLAFGVRAMTGYGPELLVRVLPYALVSHALSTLVSGGWRTGLRAWLGARTRLAHFPFWIGASRAAVANVVACRPIIPVDARRRASPAWPQCAAIVLLTVAAAIGVGRYLGGSADGDPWAFAVNLGWAVVDLVVLSTVAVMPRRRAAAR